jgi:hypothetical protein
MDLGASRIDTYIGQFAGRRPSGWSNAETPQESICGLRIELPQIGWTPCADCRRAFEAARSLASGRPASYPLAWIRQTRVLVRDGTGQVGHLEGPLGPRFLSVHGLDPITGRMAAEETSELGANRTSRANCGPLRRGCLRLLGECDLEPTSAVRSNPAECRLPDPASDFSASSAGSRTSESGQRPPNVAIHCSAMSTRRTKRTPSCASAYSMKSRTAAARVAWPLHRGCSPTDIILPARAFRASPSM